VVQQLAAGGALLRGLAATPAFTTCSTADKHPTPLNTQENCTAFVGSVQQLQDTVGKYVAAVDQQVGRIEAEKLRAVGLRNRVAALHEVRFCSFGGCSV